MNPTMTVRRRRRASQPNHNRKLIACLSIAVCLAFGWGCFVLGGIASGHIGDRVGKSLSALNSHLKTATEAGGASFARLRDGAAARIDSVATQVDNGADTVRAGMDRVESGVDRLRGGIEQLTTTIEDRATVARGLPTGRRDGGADESHGNPELSEPAPSMHPALDRPTGDGPMGSRDSVDTRGTSSLVGHDPTVEPTGADAADGDRKGSSELGVDVTQPVEGDRGAEAPHPSIPTSPMFGDDYLAHLEVAPEEPNDPPSASTLKRSFAATVDPGYHDTSDREAMEPDLHPGQMTGLPVDSVTTECDGLPEGEVISNLAASGGHANSQVWGVPELVTRCTVQQIGGFHVRSAANSKNWRREDATMAARVAFLVNSSDPRFVLPEATAAAVKARSGGWAKGWFKTSKAVHDALGRPGVHHYWKFYQQYPRYDIRDCPVTTPECIAYLIPELQDPRVRYFKQGNPLGYRKCCVEHRRLRDLLFWTVDVLEAAEDPEVRKYALTYGALIAALRDGGALSAADTDIDVFVQQARRDEVRETLKGAERPRFVGKIFEDRHEMTVVGWRSPKKGVDVDLSASGDLPDHFTPADSHIELYDIDGEYAANAWWEKDGPVPMRKGGERLIEPLRPCLFWNRVMQCPDQGNRILTRQYGGWQNPARTPPLHGMLGLAWCGNSYGHSCSVKLVNESVVVEDILLDNLP